MCQRGAFRSAIGTYFPKAYFSSAVSVQTPSKDYGSFQLNEFSCLGLFRLYRIRKQTHFYGYRALLNVMGLNFEFRWFPYKTSLILSITNN